VSERFKRVRKSFNGDARHARTLGNAMEIVVVRSLIIITSRFLCAIDDELKTN